MATTPVPLAATTYCIYTGLKKLRAANLELFKPGMELWRGMADLDVSGECTPLSLQVLLQADASCAVMRPRVLPLVRLPCQTPHLCWLYAQLHCNLAQRWFSRTT